MDLSRDDLLDLHEALERAADDLEYASTFPSNGYDDDEVSRQTTAWLALRDRIAAALATMGEAAD